MSCKIDQLVSSHEAVSTLLSESGFGLCGLLDGKTTKPRPEHDTTSGLVDDISKLQQCRADLLRLKQDLLRQELYQQTENIFNAQTFGDVLAWCDEVVNHLASLSSNRDILLYYLQQPHTANCLSMHAKHHREMEELLTGLCSVIRNTCKNITLLQDCRLNTLQPTLDSCVGTLSRLHGNLRMALTDIQALEAIPSSLQD